MLLKDQFYTPEEVARLLKVSKQTVWAWTRSGELGSLRLGRSVRVPRSALERFLQRADSNNEEQGKSEPVASQVRWREAIARADALRSRIKARVGGPLPSSVDELRALRQERSRER